MVVSHGIIDLLLGLALTVFLSTAQSIISPPPILKPLPLPPTTSVHSVVVSVGLVEFEQEEDEEPLALF